MTTAQVLGAFIVALPSLVLAWAVLWRRHRPVFFFAVALIVVGVGYLTATGASEEIARRFAPNLVAPARA